MPLCRLIYISENQLNRSDGSVVKQLSSILEASNRNNKAVGLTGALVFDDMWFLQALEGERSDVWRTFKRIGRDERHSEVAVVEMVEVKERHFGNWWMGLAQRGPDTEAFFAPYVSNGLLKAERMSAEDILSLMTQLAKRGLNRGLAAAA